MLTKKEAGAGFQILILEFEIKVPNNFNIYANTSGGDIKIGGVKW